MYQINDERAKEMLNELADDLRNNRAILIIDSKSHDFTCYFQVVSISGTRGKSSDYMPLLNYLGFKPWMSHGVQEGNITHCAGRFAHFVWDNIRINASEKGMEIPDDWSEITSNVYHF